MTSGRQRLRSVGVGRFLEITALSALAIGQPLLDLYGSEPAAFSSADLSRGQVWAFLAIVLLGPGVAISALTLVAQAIDPRFARAVHLSFSGVLLALVGLVLARHLAPDSDVVAVILSGLVLTLGLIGHSRKPNFGTWLRYAAVLAPLVFLSFLIGSPSGPLLWKSEARLVEAEADGDHAPILFVLLDELSLAPLLTEAGTVNADRFPGFARLAEQSTWYRNATSVSNATEQAVPALLTGNLPNPDLSPFSWDHPRNLFTLLGNRYVIDAYEPITSLCPSTACSARRRMAASSQAPTFLVEDLLDVANGIDLPHGAVVRDVAVGGLELESLWAHAPLTIHLPLSASRGDLSFSYGMAGEEPFLTPGSNGVEFEVRVRFADGTDQSIFKDAYLPGADPVAPEWRSATVRLPGPEPEPIGLMFITDDRGNGNYDWSAWSEIRITNSSVEHNADTSSPARQAVQADDPELPANTDTPDGGLFKHFLDDALIVYGHLSMPPSLRSTLPRIDQSWGSFAQQQDPSDSSPPAHSPLAPDPVDEGTSASVDLGQLFHVFRSTDSGLGQVAVLESMVGQLIDDARNESAATSPTLTFFHGLIPHRPYELPPDGRFYRTRSQASNWGTTEHDLNAARQHYQRFLMQTAFLDSVLDQAIISLQAAGVWDDLLVAVVADHGVTWRPGSNPRDSVHDREGASDIYRVPMFIKSPGQVAGRTDDCPVSTIDILPTLIGALDISTDWSFDGRDLTEACPTGSERSFFDAEGQEINGPGNDLVDLYERSDVYRQWVADAGGVSGIAAIGRSGSHVGHPLPDGLVHSAHVHRWSLDQAGSLESGDGSRGTFVPAWLSGTIEVHTGLPPGSEGLIVVDGVSVGVVMELDAAPAGSVRFATIIDVELLSSDTPEVLLAVSLPDDSIELVGPPEP